MAALNGWDNHCKSTAGSYLAVLCRTACLAALGEPRVVPLYRGKILVSLLAMGV